MHINEKLFNEIEYGYGDSDTELIYPGTNDWTTVTTVFNQVKAQFPYAQIKNLNPDDVVIGIIPTNSLLYEALIAYQANTSFEFPLFEIADLDFKNDEFDAIDEDSKFYNAVFFISDYDVDVKTSLFLNHTTAYQDFLAFINN